MRRDAACLRRECNPRSCAFQHPPRAPFLPSPNLTAYDLTSPSPLSRTRACTTASMLDEEMVNYTTLYINAKPAIRTSYSTPQTPVRRILGQERRTVCSSEGVRLGIL